MGSRHALTVAMVLALGVHAGTAWSPTTPSGATTTEVTQRYAITATLDVDSGRLDAVEELTLTNRARHRIGHVNLSVIPRALGYLTLDQGVTVDGDSVRTTWTTGTNLRVPLGGDLAPGATAVIRIPFSLSVGVSGGAFTARLSRHEGVLSFGEWFPILSREHDSYGVGDPQISYTAEQIRLELTTTTALPRNAVACAGLVAAPESTGTTWTCEVENVRDFSFVVNPAFRLTTRTIGPTTMRVYAQTVSTETIADKAQTALIAFNEAYGQYPWPDLVLAEVGATDGYSMEFPRSIHLTRSKVTDTYVIYHEVSHQWFYAQLGNDQMNEPWLDEGFADFSTRWLMGTRRSQCSRRDIDSPVFAWDAEPIAGGDWQSCDGYFHAIFYKSTEFLNAVMGRMGEAAFFAALRDFIAEHRFGVVTTRQLLDHLEAWNGADLLPIYRAYLRTYDQPAPTLPARRGGICAWIDCTGTR